MTGRKTTGSAGSSLVSLEDAQLPELTPVMMGGKFVDDVTAVARSNSELFFGTGRLGGPDGDVVLIPFVDMTMLGVRQGDLHDTETEPELSVIFQNTLTLENALWLTFDMLRDIRGECVNLGKLALGDIGLDQKRLTHARFFADKAREQAELCVALFDELARARSDYMSATEPSRSPSPPAKRLRKAIRPR